MQLIHISTVFVVLVLVLVLFLDPIGSLNFTF